MTTPQMGIFSLGDTSHSYTEFVLRDGVGAGDAIRAVAAIHDPRKTTEGVNLVVGFRPEMWRALRPDAIPTDASSFQHELVGPDGFSIPATQADIFIWVAGGSYDVVFDVAQAIVDLLAAIAGVVRELTGWAYQHNRDLTGFQDGTENPSLIDAPGVALIDETQAGAGGSILLFQQWKHDARAWRAQSVEQQERVIGRTKSDSIELDERRMPPDSHVSRTTLEEGGQELPIFRRNMAYGDVGDHGTVFVGFAKQQHRLQRMLERMAGIGDGVRDALTRFSVPLSSAYYFIPALSALAQVDSGAAVRSADAGRPNPH